PQFGKDGKMQKCDYCTGIGSEPACTMSCPAEALFYGTIEELLEKVKGKNGKRMDGATKPAIIIVS
ncbi:MAG: hypothetical protein JW967_10210, partial [Dehalococcoidales bacterium]|nr:hypothetical protein [Dehalococcoidales bacterium]